MCAARARLRKSEIERITRFEGECFPAPTSWENRRKAKSPYLMHYLASPHRLTPNMAIYLCMIVTSFLLASCGSDIDSADDIAIKIPAEIFSSYQPPAEDEISEFLGIADLTVEEIRALLGEPEFEGKFIDRFPSLKVSDGMLNVEIAPGGMGTRVLNIGREGNGEFEWDFTIADQPNWLSTQRPLNTEEGDIDTLALTFDPTGLAAGDYITLR